MTVKCFQSLGFHQIISCALKKYGNCHNLHRIPSYQPAWFLEALLSAQTLCRTPLVQIQQLWSTCRTVQPLKNSWDISTIDQRTEQIFKSEVTCCDLKMVWACLSNSWLRRVVIPTNINGLFYKNATHPKIIRNLLIHLCLPWYGLEIIGSSFRIGPTLATQGLGSVLFYPMWSSVVETSCSIGACETEVLESLKHQLCYLAIS